MFLRDACATRGLLARGMLLLALAAPAGAQDVGTVRGLVHRPADGPVRSAAVRVSAQELATATNADGRFTLRNVPAGRQTLMVRSIGYTPREVPVVVVAGGIADVDVALAPMEVKLADVVVSTPSRRDERVVDAPAAISVVDALPQRALSITGQVPLALGGLPGVDASQNDGHDFNVNARGFNTTFTRRVLVLMDGRDVSIAFLGSQEWNGLSVPLEDMRQVEMVRGPGSALYGANAFSGVVNMVTPLARDVVGTKLSIAGGELGSSRADLRQGGLLFGGRFAYRINVGGYREQMWSRSRTNIGDLAHEYASAVDTSVYHVNTPYPGFEVVPIAGQSKPGPLGVPGAATGQPDDLSSVYGTARFDWYQADDAVLTVQAGDARMRNEVMLSAIGRVQFPEVERPWTQVMYTAPRWNFSAWSSGRKTIQPQVSLASGAQFEEASSLSHVEGQFHSAAASATQYALGASAREIAVDTKQSLIAPADDDRHDHMFAAYGQVSHDVLPRLNLSVAARMDASNLFATEFSPKLAVSYKLTDRESIHLTLNRAFQTPSTLQFFVHFPAGPPADFSALEAGLRASPLGPALAAVPQGALFTNSSAVPLWVLGNPALKVEHVRNIELGYKRAIGSSLFLTIDGYYSQLDNFVTDILAGVNPAYAPWTAPAQVPAGMRAAVEGAVRAALGAGPQPDVARALTRLPDGSTAVVYSLGNAGRATELGLELAASWQATRELRVDANATVNDFSVDSAGLVPGARVLPNTPDRKANLSVSYQGDRGLALWASVRFVSAFNWASGMWIGRVPPSQPIDASIEYALTRKVTVHATVTNVLGQLRYYEYGGALIGRRALAGLTTTF